VYTVVGFSSSSVETYGSATRDLVRPIGLGDGRWMELAHDRVKCRAVVLNFFLKQE
jgi:hypothetical protein